LHVEAEEVGPKVQIKECLLSLLQGELASSEQASMFSLPLAFKGSLRPVLLYTSGTAPNG